MTYFGDREFGEQSRTQEEVGENAWGGLKALIYARVEDGSFGAGYPSSCTDGEGPTGTNEEMLRQAMHGEVPGLSLWPWLSDEIPDTIRILELMEFCWLKIGQPVQVGERHKWLRHYHLKFDIEVGRQGFCQDVNRILGRNGLAYTLTDEGHIERLAPPVLREGLASAHFQSGDVELDRLLETARRKYLSPLGDVRREALQELWDAWERLKTTGEGAKKRDQISALLDEAAGPLSRQFHKHIQKDAIELTAIGNNLQIRHSEVGKEKVQKSEHIDYLFHCLFSMVQIILQTKGT